MIYVKNTWGTNYVMSANNNSFVLALFFIFFFFIFSPFFLIMWHLKTIAGFMSTISFTNVNIDIIQKCWSPVGELSTEKKYNVTTNHYTCDHVTTGRNTLFSVLGNYQMDHCHRLRPHLFAFSDHIHPNMSSKWPLFGHTHHVIDHCHWHTTSVKIRWYYASYFPAWSSPKLIGLSQRWHHRQIKNKNKTEKWPVSTLKRMKYKSWWKSRLQVACNKT